MPVAVIGSGDEWLSLSLKFAASGLPTRAVTGRGDALDDLEDGQLPRGGMPPAAHRLFAKARDLKTLEATDSYAEVEGCDSIVLAPPVPLVSGRREASLARLGEVFDDLNGRVQPGALVVVATRVPPGTMLGFVKPRLERASGQQVFVGVLLAAVPERVQGADLYESPERYNRIVGRADPASAKRAVGLYKRISRGELDLCDIQTAALVCAAEGAILETHRALAIEIALACDAFGASPSRVRELLRKSPRSGMDLPRAEAAAVTPPLDSTLLKAATHNRLRLPLIDAAGSVAQSGPRLLARLAHRALKRARKEPKFTAVAVLGLASHPNSADTTASPSFALIQEFKTLGFQDVRLHDPFVQHDGSRSSDGELDGLVRGVGVLVLATPHDVYLSRMPHLLGIVGPGAVVVDARGSMPRAEVERRGLTYVGLAR
ncbi:MAG TPA: UDP binding domain-containing protein [Candidatus Thermoplasmatota archaeon]